tara:strand:- start:422 stop:589 length:168 start_codon:yes stop_codon:yes gene_type:complete
MDNVGDEVGSLNNSRFVASWSMLTHRRHPKLQPCTVTCLEGGQLVVAGPLRVEDE